MAFRLRIRLVVVFGLLFIAGSATALCPASATPATPATPPDDTFEVTINSGVVVAPGGTISFTGTCWSSVLGAARQALVVGSRRVPLGSDIEPYQFTIEETVNINTGALSGTLLVPGDAPNGTYALRLACLTQDQYLGDGQQLFTIDGPQITTSTTASTTTTVRPGLTAVPAPAPAPARPVSGIAELTG